MWALALWDHDMPLLQWGAVTGISLTGAVFDLTSRRIPNGLTLPAWLAGMIWAAATAGSPGLADAVCASLLLALPFVLLFAFAGGGAGDAKLMAALGAWLGLANGAITLLAVVAAGALCGLGLALAKQRFLAVMARLALMLLGVLLLAGSRGRRLAQVRLALQEQPEMMTMPYGVAILIGVCVAGAGILLWRL